MKVAVWAEWVSASVTILLVVLAVLVFAGCGKSETPDPAKEFTASYLNVSVVGFAKGDGQPASEREFHLAIIRGAEE